MNKKIILISALCIVLYFTAFSVIVLPGIIEEITFTGIKTDDDGVLYYYRDGEIGSGIYLNELAEINGSVYLVKWSGKVAANETRVIDETNSNGLLPSGTYTFGADGKLTIE